MYKDISIFKNKKKNPIISIWLFGLHFSNKSVYKQAIVVIAIIY